MKEFIEKLIKRLKEETEIYSGGLGNMHYSVRAIQQGKAIQIINELAEEYNNGWIPCSEKLPEEAKTILICTKTGLVDVGARHVSYEHNEYKTYKNIFWDDEVIAWQPLPQPYKEGSEADG